jgi:hypothetical protein
MLQMHLTTTSRRRRTLLAATGARVQRPRRDASLDQAAQLPDSILALAEAGLTGARHDVEPAGELVAAS